MRKESSALGLLFVSDAGHILPGKLEIDTSSCKVLHCPMGFSLPALCISRLSPSQLGLLASLLQLAVAVKNSSASSLSISGIKAIGNYTAAGSGTTPCGGSLGAGATCTMAVTFNPTINGTIKGAVAIANSTAVSPQIYNVSGAAVLPLTFSPARLTFASQAVGSTSAAKTVTLTNNASAAMSSISFVASGDYAAFATGATPCGASLPAHGKCTIGVTFTPSATGTIKGNVTVTYSGVTQSFSPQEMNLTGTGK